MQQQKQSLSQKIQYQHINAAPLSTQIAPPLINQSYSPSQLQIQQLKSSTYSPEDFQQLTKLFQSAEQIKQIHGLIGINKIFTSYIQVFDKLQIRQYIKNKLIKKCQYYLQHNSDIFVEQSLSIMNLLINNQLCNQIVKLGLIQLVIKLLNKYLQNIQTHKNIVKNCLRILCGISADSYKHRDQVIKANGVQIVLSLLKESKDQQLIDQSIHLFSKIICTEPFPKFKQIKQVMQIIVKEFVSDKFQQKRQEIVINILRSLANLTNKSFAISNDEDSSKVIYKLSKFVVCNKQAIILPALKILGNLTAESYNEKNREVIDHDFLNLACILIKNPNKAIRRQTCRILSNITVGTEKQKKVLIQHIILQQIGSLLAADQTEVKKQICSIFINLINLIIVQPQLFNLFTKYNLLDIILQFIKSNNSSCILLGLQSLYKLLCFGDKNQVDLLNIFLDKFIKLKGMQRVSDLQSHVNQDISKKSTKIIEKFYV